MFTLKENIWKCKIKAIMQLLYKRRCFAPGVSLWYKFINHSNKGIPYRKVQNEGSMILSFPWTNTNSYGINIHSAIKINSLAQSKTYRWLWNFCYFWIWNPSLDFLTYTHISIKIHSMVEDVNALVILFERQTVQY